MIFNDFNANAGGEFNSDKPIGTIPDGTDVIAVIDACKWQEGFGASDPRNIQIKWKVARPEQYVNRVIFQKIHAEDATRAETAKRMLEAIDGNARGVLTAAIKKRGGAPLDEDLATLTGATMQIKLGLWEQGDKKGNWVKAVRPASGIPAGKAVAAAPAHDDGFNADDIPF